LCVIQYDAHSDLRDEFLGERVCHATAMARVLDSVPRGRLYQFGIRSFSRAEEMKAPNLFAFDVLSAVEEVCRAIGPRPVYVTVDIDVLDPGVMPEVQTPQPGGCSYLDLARSLAGLSRLKVVGADLVEFCPRLPQPSAGASVAAELVRELVLLLSGTKMH
jgi:agmatinase